MDKASAIALEQETELKRSARAAPDEPTAAGPKAMVGRQGSNRFENGVFIDRAATAAAIAKTAKNAQDKPYDYHSAWPNILM